MRITHIAQDVVEGRRASAQSKQRAEVITLSEHALERCLRRRADRDRSTTTTRGSSRIWVADLCDAPRSDDDLVAPLHAAGITVVAVGMLVPHRKCCSPPRVGMRPARRSEVNAWLSE
jgi:hypothetical protein